MIKMVCEHKTSTINNTIRRRRVFYHACYVLLAIQLLIFNTAFAKGITLNMKGADISAVIGTVAEATGKNFIIDPRVKGKVTIISSKPLNTKQLYQVFLAILDVHGFTAVETGEVIKILPDADAKHAGTPSEGIGEEVVTMVVEVKHIAAAQMVPILRPLVPPQGHLAAHAQTNTLIIADRVSNIERLMKIIKRIDEPSGSEIEIVQLEHASASEVVRVLTSLQQKNKKNKGKGALTLVADERTNSILIGGKKTQRLGVKAIIAHLDTPSEVTGNTHVIYLNYAKAKDLVTVLTGVGQSKAKGAKKGKSKARSSTTFNIQADEATNALVITAPPDIYRSLESVIRKLDVRRAQVMVEAIIAEVSIGKTNELGIQWFGDGSNSNLPVGLTNLGPNSIAGVGAAIGAGSAETGSPLLAAIGQNPGMSLAIGRFNSDNVNFGALISALAGEGEANLLSTPNIVTMDNEEAEIFVGREVSIPSGAFTQPAGGAGVNPFTTFKPKQVGIRLKVKPQINEGDAIKLEIDQSVDAITAGIAGTASLVTSQRKIKTSVMVEDGGIIVLGGLMTDDEKETVQKVPLLGDIPLLGYLFRYKRVEKEKANLMVFLRPKILRDAAVTSAISGSKYQFMRNEQMRVRDIGEEEIMRMMPRVDEFLPDESLKKPDEAQLEKLDEMN